MSAEEMIARIDAASTNQELAKSYFGIVVIMDALGAKSLSIEGAKEFLKLRKTLVHVLPSILQEFESLTMEGLRAEPINAQSEFDVLTFGDSFIFLYSCDPDKISLALYWVGLWCAQSMMAAMESRVFLRGALSIGEYLYGGLQSNTVLGPAVADAASWCEQADWIGVTVTPSAGYFLEKPENNPNGSQDDSPSEYFAERSFIKYPVPTKGGGQEELWTLMWPSGLFDPDKPDSMLQKLAEYFAGAPMPKGSESKYANTWKYVNWLRDESLKRASEGDGSAASVVPTSKS